MQFNNQLNRQEILGMQQIEQIEDMIRMNQQYQKNRKNKKRKSLQNVLINLQKQRLYSTIIQQFTRKNPKIQTAFKQISINHNLSIQNIKNKTNHISAFNTLVQFQQSKQLQTKPLIKTKNTTLVIQKQITDKKPKNLLPQLPQYINNNNDHIINPKDKKIQNLFFKLAKSKEFIYSISFPKKYFIQFIAKAFTKKFAQYFNWFFQLRPVIDYKYYVDLAKKILTMDNYQILHFVYSAFEGFNHKFCFQMFKQNFGEKQLLFISRARSQLKQDYSRISFERLTYNELKQRNLPQNKSFELSTKLDTVYKNTFFCKQLVLNKIKKEKYKNLNQHMRENGELSFEQYCKIYNNKTPNFYFQVMFKLFCQQLKQNQIQIEMKQKHYHYLEQLNQQQQRVKFVEKPISKLMNQLMILKQRRNSLNPYY